ncbi:MAG TPA: pyridoxamine 5'-phosphate oxidase [Acidimicrobiales bacterium]|nr:pyridoxamine 5'-phosphate oxidase [Acidimicrobiales bacterium]
MSETGVPLDVASVDPDPFGQFQTWFDEAQPFMHEREAVALVTATPKGAPSARMVLLRHHDQRSFGWYSNYESRKGGELSANPHAALLWYCEPLGRQIRIEGTVIKMSPLASDAYFATRARASQLGAIASDQSRALASRAQLEARFSELRGEYEGRDVPRPAYWGGYYLTPSRFEFWQHRDDRLHDRVIYLLEDATWRLERQFP